jgi:hypothetical protein
MSDTYFNCLKVLKVKIFLVLICLVIMVPYLIIKEKKYHVILFFFLNFYFFIELLYMSNKKRNYQVTIFFVFLLQIKTKELKIFLILFARWLFASGILK